MVTALARALLWLPRGGRSPPIGSWQRPCPEAIRGTARYRLWSRPLNPLTWLDAGRAPSSAPLFDSFFTLFRLLLLQIDRWTAAWPSNIVIGDIFSILIIRNCSEIAQKLLCNCSEIALKLYWICSEIALKLIWNCSEIALKLHWICSKIALKLLWNCSEIALKLLWNCSEFVPKLLWNCSEMALKLLWNCSKIALQCRFWKWVHSNAT